MSLRKIAELIPPEYRREILELNMIDEAVAAVGNAPMHYLTIVWKDFIEPEFTGDCDKCLSRVLRNFKEMKATMIEMENDSQLLKTA